MGQLADALSIKFVLKVPEQFEQAKAELEKHFALASTNIKSPQTISLDLTSPNIEKLASGHSTITFRTDRAMDEEFKLQMKTHFKSRSQIHGLQDTTLKIETKSIMAMIATPRFDKPALTRVIGEAFKQAHIVWNEIAEKKIRDQRAQLNVDKASELRDLAALRGQG